MNRSYVIDDESDSDEDEREPSGVVDVPSSSVLFAWKPSDIAKVRAVSIDRKGH